VLLWFGWYGECRRQPAGPSAGASAAAIAAAAAAAADAAADAAIHVCPPTLPPAPPSGFNPGSTLNVIATTATDSANLYLTSGRATVTTTLAGAAAVVVALVSSLVRTGAWDLLAVCNGALVGFVSVTAGAAVLEPWAAIVAGAVGVAIFDTTCWLWLKLSIDDPLSASPMHGICGAWGVLVTGLLAAPHYMAQAYPPHMGAGRHYGAFYPGSSGKLLASQVVGVAVIAAWTLFWSGARPAASDKGGVYRLRLARGGGFAECHCRIQRIAYPFWPRPPSPPRPPPPRSSLKPQSIVLPFAPTPTPTPTPGLLFFILRAFRRLRISPEEEQMGLDVSKHGGSAYNHDHGLGKGGPIPGF
jgi:ammonia channel protein AmtB